MCFGRGAQFVSESQLSHMVTCVTFLAQGCNLQGLLMLDPLMCRACTVGFEWTSLPFPSERLLTQKVCVFMILTTSRLQVVRAVTSLPFMNKLPAHRGL